MKVVLLHALPLDERMWAPQLPALAEHEVVTPRLYDLGDSMEDWADAVLRLVEGRFAVVGASMGGYLALTVARRAPERLAGVVVSGSRAEADPPERREVRDRWLELVAERGAPALWEEMERGPFSTVQADARRRLGPIVEAQSAEGLANAITAIRDRADSRDVVASLAVPFLLVVGDGDPLITPEDARAQAASAPDGRAEVFEGVGHLPSYEEPERFNAVLRAFLGGLS